MYLAESLVRVLKHIERLIESSEKGLSSIRARLVRHRRNASHDGPVSSGVPPGPGQWEALYSSEVSAVDGISSPVARVLAEHTGMQDSLLEAGCGSGRLSAELAWTGRRVELADFSPLILQRAQDLFRRSGLYEPKVHEFDITNTWPIEDASIDTVWSSGVLEHWTDAELLPIVQEMNRVCRKAVISLVPYAGSIFYRLGKWRAESTGEWLYGRELPRYTLRPVFEMAGLHNISEYPIWGEQSLWFLQFVNREVRAIAENWWASLSSDDRIQKEQGYLLLTVGYKQREMPDLNLAAEIPTRARRKQSHSKTRCV